MDEFPDEHAMQLNRIAIALQVEAEAHSNRQAAPTTIHDSIRQLTGLAPPHAEMNVPMKVYISFRHDKDYEAKGSE